MIDKLKTIKQKIDELDALVNSYIAELKQADDRVKPVVTKQQQQAVKPVVTKQQQQAEPIVTKQQQQAVEPIVKKHPIEEEIKRPIETITANELSSTLEELNKLLQSNAWPNAVDTQLICNPDSEEDKSNRAEGIVELLIEEPLKDKNFLDFGCGEGHIPFRAAKDAAFAVGYDIKSYPTWDNLKRENLILTNNLNDVTNQLYDIILIYDVLDHVNSEEEALNILVTCKKLLKEKGTIYLRTHPYCSRHATHSYHKLNKAFIHLIFTPQELSQIGIEVQQPGFEVIYPLKQYKDLIAKANLKLITANVLRERVEPFFTQTQIIAKRIRNLFKMPNSFPTFQLEQQFIDFILK